MASQERQVLEKKSVSHLTTSLTNLFFTLQTRSNLTTPLKSSDKVHLALSCLASIEVLRYAEETVRNYILAGLDYLTNLFHFR